MSTDATTYLVVKGWDRHFENNRSRDIKSLKWFPCPNQFDGEGYTELVDADNGAELYGAWTALLGVASRCDTRGYLVRKTGLPHTPKTLSRQTRLAESAFEQMIEKVIEIGWLERAERTPALAGGDVSTPSAPTPHAPAVVPQRGAVVLQAGADWVRGGCGIASKNGRKGTEENGTERTEKHTERASGIDSSARFTLDPIRRVFPSRRRGGKLGDYEAINGALQAIQEGAGGVRCDDPLAWLTDRVQKYSVSPKGKSRFGVSLVRWMREGWWASEEEWDDAEEQASEREKLW